MKNLPSPRTTALVVAALLVTAACSSTPVYPHDHACSMDAAMVGDVLDSDRFTAEEKTLPGVPLTSSAPGTTGCSIDHDENRLVVEARIVDEGTAEDEAAKAQDADTFFEYRGGLGGTTAKGVSWICGNVLVRVYVLEEPESPPDWQKLAEPVWDDVGCLTYSTPGVSDQPEGWTSAT